MNTRKIVAIGWGENWRIKEWKKFPYETGPIDEEIIRLTGKQHPNFLFLGHAQADSLERQESYFETMKDIYGVKYGCYCKDLKTDKLTDVEYVQNLIDWADIIYEWWWETVSMVTLRKETWFDKILRKARESGKVMCGVSAWWMCWFKKCSNDSISDIWADWLWFMDWLLEPHCQAPGVQESIKELLLNKEPEEIWLMLSNCAALEIIDNQYRMLTSDASNYWMEKGFWKKTYRKDGKYIEEELDDSLEFKTLSKLYSKL